MRIEDAQAFCLLLPRVLFHILGSLTFPRATFYELRGDLPERVRCKAYR